MIRRPPRSTLSSSSAASDVYKRQVSTQSTGNLSQTAMVLVARAVRIGLMLGLIAALAAGAELRALDADHGGSHDPDDEDAFEDPDEDEAAVANEEAELTAAEQQTEAEVAKVEEDIEPTEDGLDDEDEDGLDMVDVVQAAPTPAPQVQVSSGPAQSGAQQIRGDLQACQLKFVEEEQRMLHFETESGLCEQKVEKADLELVKAERALSEQENLRAKAILEAKAAVEEEKKAVELAQKEKSMREEAVGACASRIQVLEEANQAAVEDKEASALAHKKKMQEKEAEIRLKTEQEKTVLIDKMNGERDEAIKSVQLERDLAIKSTKDAAAAKIKAAQLSIKEGESRNQAEAALALAEKGAEMEAQVAKSEAEKDEAVTAAQDERDAALQNLQDLKHELAAAQANLKTTMEARTMAEMSLAKYKGWAEGQLNQAKDAVAKAHAAAVAARKALAAKPVANPASSVSS
eukprot:TRINITY_DN11980_c0_g1_i4.p1 TRINITY_DN11980_c0_g1~~TRINITY_DN11980_c0_g1_i4.p1  ORF type:complete len:463 (-),score=180.34 TRINITY_DN11980_c0_g1_i4:425-1813(-)